MFSYQIKNVFQIIIKEKLTIKWYQLQYEKILIKLDNACTTIILYYYEKCWLGSQDDAQKKNETTTLFNYYIISALVKSKSILL